MIAEKTSPQLIAVSAISSKSPPLRVRKADIKAQVEYYISLYCRANGIPNKPKVTPESCVAAYDFPAISGLQVWWGNPQALQS